MGEAFSNCIMKGERTMTGIAVSRRSLPATGRRIRCDEGHTLNLKRQYLQRLQAIAWGALVLAIVLGAWRPGQAQNPKAAYPTMAPLDQYLMDRDAEIALARSAAPEAISHDADVLVLGRQGYETAVKGKNGFVCLVERGWTGAFSGDSSVKFWNPRMRGPVCFNPQAARSVLPITYKRTELALAGQSKAQIFDGMKAFVKQDLPPLEPGAMSYMMSKEQYLTDGEHHNWIAHLMFYTPLMGSVEWGADLPNSPVMVNPQFNGDPEPIREFMVPAGWWSDGTADPVSVR
jgi:hypothetical protein